MQKSKDQDLEQEIRGAQAKEKAPSKTDLRTVALVEVGRILKASGLQVKASTGWQVKIRGIKGIPAEQVIHVGTCTTKSW